MVEDGVNESSTNCFFDMHGIAPAPSERRVNHHNGGYSGLLSLDLP